MTSNRSVSVIIPTYNRAGVVSRAIDSVIAASAEFDCEIIIVDDASADIEELRVVAARYPQVRLIEKQQRVNAAHSRRIGFDLCASDYVFFLDSDDEYQPSHLARRHEMMSTSPFGVVFGNYNLARDGVRTAIAIPAYTGGDMREYLLVRKGTFLTSTVTINKRHSRGAMYDGIWYQHQDWALALTAADLGEQIGFDPEPGVTLYDDAGGRMGRYSSIDACRQFCDRFLRDYPRYRNIFVLAQMYRFLRNNSSETFFALAKMLDDGQLTARQRMSAAAMGAVLRTGLASPLVRFARTARGGWWRLKRQWSRQ